MTFTSLNIRMGIPEKIIPKTYEACTQLIVVIFTSNFGDSIFEKILGLRSSRDASVS